MLEFVRPASATATIAIRRRGSFSIHKLSRFTLGMNPNIDAVRERLRLAAEASGMTQQQIGEAMGFSPASARQAVSRLLNPEVSHDPRLSTLLAFADAVGKPLHELLTEQKKRASPAKSR